MKQAYIKQAKKGLFLIIDGVKPITNMDETIEDLNGLLDVEDTRSHNVAYALMEDEVELILEATKKWLKENPTIKTNSKTGRKYIDEMGNKYTKLTVVKKTKSKNGHLAWLCKCQCGNETIVLGSDLRRGFVKSCGCHKDSMIAKRSRIHGMSGIPEFTTWVNMLSRCYKTYNSMYQYYGGRGIKVCSRWNNFKNFYEDMGNKPKEKTLDRIDNDGNYTPENCKWSTRTEQQNNTSNNRMITFAGITRTTTQWARSVGLSPKRVENRINALGWSIPKTLLTPLKGNSPVEQVSAVRDACEEWLELESQRTMMEGI